MPSRIEADSHKTVVVSVPEGSLSEKPPDALKGHRGSLEGLGEINLTFIEEEDEGDGGSLGKENNNSVPTSAKASSSPTAAVPIRERRRSSVSVERTLRQAKSRTIRRVSRVFSSVGLLPQLDVKLVGISEQELLLQLFDAFDYYRNGKLNQDKWIDLLKMRLNQCYSDSPFPSQFEERKVDFVEIIESVSYAVFGDADLTFDSFCIVFQTKNVLTKFYRLIDRDLDGVVTVEQVMEFISQLSSARCGSRLTRDNIAYLERLFRQYVGDDKEIKKSDFSKIIQTKNQFFTDRVFDIFDDDANGSISLQEFLDAMHKFTGENPEDKIRFLFKVYDVDGDGLIQEVELEQVMRACMEENGMKFSDEQIHELTTALFEDADVERRGALTYDALKGQLEKHGGLLENLSISIERWLVPVKPVIIKRKASLLTKLRARIPHQCSSKYLKNNYVFVIWIAAFLLTNFTLLVTRAISYSTNNVCATIWLVLAKTTGQALNFNCTYILVMMLKQCLTFLRARGASKYLPIDQHLYFHKLAGYFIVGQGFVHSVAHLLNIHFGFVQNPTQDTNCYVIEQRNWSYVEYLFVPKATPSYGLIPGFAFNTGIIIFIILSIMFVCSLPFVRRSGYFQVFYWTHTLYIFFWIFLIIHATNFFWWFMVPGIIFIIEQVVRIYSWKLGKGKTFISSGILLPSKVTHLIIKRPSHFHFHPGDYVFVRIPAIAKFEWHPFTISSSPEQEDAIWIHVRAAGEWTTRLYEYFEQEQSNLNPDIWDFRTKTDAFTKGVKYQRKKVPSQKFLGNPLTANPVTRPQLMSVADSVTSFTPDSNHSSSGNMTLDNATLTSYEDVLDETFKDNRKVVLSKMKSMPNMAEKIDNMQHMRKFSRSESVQDSPDPSPLGSFDSANRSRRYLRYKPPIIMFKTPKDEDDAEKGMRVNLITESRRKNSKGDHPECLAEEGQVYNLSPTSDLAVTNDPNVAVACYELGTTRISRDQLDGKSLEIFIDGPLGASSSQIFRAEHAVLIATGIGVTPFASILQSIMRRYWASRNTCPNCTYTWCSELPESVLHLKKVDFFWINRDQRSFEWFVHLLSQLEIEQAELGGAMERFLDMHMYITSALQKTDMKAVGLQLALDLLHEKEKRDLITGLKTRTNAGRPNWNKIFRQLQDQKKGKVTIFYCGPPALARTLKLKCDEFGFSFRKEIF